MYRRWTALVFSTMLISGCAIPQQPIYDHPTASQAEKQRDVVECSAQASQAAAGAGNVYTHPDLRAVAYQNARSQFFTLCLESRGWKERLGPAPPPRPADYSAARRCQQEALYLLDLYNGPRDGSGTWPAWQKAHRQYLVSHGLAVEPPPPDEQLMAVLDRDLAARHASMNWPVCLESSQR
jgi:hypothetical protein